MALVDLGFEGQVVWFEGCGQASKREYVFLQAVLNTEI